MMFTIEDLANYLDVEPGDVNETRFAVLSAKARALIEAYKTDLPEDYDDWPAGAKAVALDVVARAWQQQDVAGVTSIANTAGPFQQTRQFSSSAGSVWLSKQDKAILSGGSGGRGAFAVDLNVNSELGRLWLRPDEWRPLWGSR